MTSEEKKALTSMQLQNISNLFSTSFLETIKIITYLNRQRPTLHRCLGDKFCSRIQYMEIWKGIFPEDQPGFSRLHRRMVLTQAHKTSQQIHWGPLQIKGVRNTHELFYDLINALIIMFPFQHFRSLSQDGIFFPTVFAKQHAPGILVDTLYSFVKILV